MPYQPSSVFGATTISSARRGLQVWLSAAAGCRAVGPIVGRNDRVVLTAAPAAAPAVLAFNLVLALSLSSSLRNAVPDKVLAEFCSETVAR